VGIRCADQVTPSTRKSRHYFADSGGRSVGIVRLRTKTTEFVCFVIIVEDFEAYFILNQTISVDLPHCAFLV
jgi:hypothetical protein